MNSKVTTSDSDIEGLHGITLITCDCLGFAKTSEGPSIRWNVTAFVCHCISLVPQGLVPEGSGRVWKGLWCAVSPPGVRPQGGYTSTGSPALLSVSSKIRRNERHERNEIDDIS